MKSFPLAVLLTIAAVGMASQGSNLPAAGDEARQPGREVLNLTLRDAIRLALAPPGSGAPGQAGMGNTNVRLAAEMVRQAQARSGQARASLLPGFDTYVGWQDQTRNLSALGIRLQVPGFQIPEIVGPFQVVDVRASVTQSLFDLSAIRRYQAARLNVDAARSESEAVRDQTTDRVARAYLASLKAEASVDAAKAGTVLAEAIVQLAENQKTAGTGTGIEITRANVQLMNERQRLLVAQNEANRARLQLLRVIGLPLETEVNLTDDLGYVPVEGTTSEQALEIALKTRWEWKGQHTREQSAKLSYAAVKMERMPTVAAFGDYGTIGSGVDRLLPTRTFGISVRVPVFDGGRRDARRGESLAQYRQETIRTEDLRMQIELEIRQALDSLRSAEGQVKAAEEGLRLARTELEQAQRRYKAGVAGSIEVTDAQTRLERARDNRIAALYNHNISRIDLAAAMGTVQTLAQ